MIKWEYAWLVVAGFFITVGIGIALEGHIFAERIFGIGTLEAIFGMMLIIILNSAIMIRSSREPS
ncbi:MAG: hypothetical protein Q6364_08280 [Candidatus Hermodarchaeota archaeon]|nr:hypothetical protein [Candidatus Hermodarchaeota archaeon]